MQYQTSDHQQKTEAHSNEVPQQSKSLCALFIDANTARSRQTIDQIAALTGEFTGTFARSGQEALDLCNRARFDCAVIHQALPDHNGLWLIGMLRSHTDFTPIPVIVIADQAESADAILAMRAGAADFMANAAAGPQWLLQAITYAVHRHQISSAMDGQLLQTHLDNLELSKRQSLQLADRQALVHTLLTPLAATQEYLSLVLDGVAGKLSEEQGKLLAIARGRTQQLANAVETLITQQTPQHQRPENSHAKVALAPLIDEVVGLYALQAADRGIHLGSAIEPGAQIVSADEYQLKALLLSLTSKLLRTCAPSGNILILAEDDRAFAGSVRLTLRAQVGMIPSAAASTLSDQAANQPSYNDPTHPSVSTFADGEYIIETTVDSDLQFEFCVPAA